MFYTSCQTSKPDSQTSVVPTTKITTDSLETISVSNDTTKVLVLFKTPYRFEQFSVPVFSGKLHQPDFSNNPFRDDPLYVKFINEGCAENGINFGGKYTVLVNGCGLMCQHLFIIDRTTGFVFNDIELQEGYYGYKFRPNSNLFIANANLFVDEKFQYYEQTHDVPKLFVWSKTVFKPLQ